MREEKRLQLMEVTPEYKPVRRGNNVVMLRGVSSFDADYTLHKAAIKGNLVKVTRLIAVGAKLNNFYRGNSPLHWACEYGHKQIVELLINHGVKLNVKNSLGHTELMLAAWNGYVCTTKRLLAYGARINAKTKEGFTCLHFAAHEGHVDVIKLLLKNRTKMKDRKSTRLNSSHIPLSRMPSSA